METLAEGISSLIAELAEIELAEVTPERTLREIGVDSLMVLELVAFIEKTTCTTVSESDIKAVKTVGDLIERAERAVTAGPGHSGVS